jgi:hypothetical protein
LNKKAYTTDEARTSPFGLWRYGNDFRLAAIAVLKANPRQFSMPYYFLIGQSIELSLKAFLLGRGTSLRELRGRKYGHNLEALMKLSQRRRLDLEIRLSNLDIGVVRLLNIEYQVRRFQYQESGMISVPDIHLIQDVADRLSESLQNFCVKKTKSPT